MRLELLHLRRVGSVVLVLAAACLSVWAAQSSADAFTTAHAMHQRLQQVPVSERHAADYEHIVAQLSPLWAKAGTTADSARFQAASVYVAMARDLNSAKGWDQAAQLLRDLLHKSPYTVYRRNAEWSLAQIEIFHLHEPKSAAVWLRDFQKRYPADPRIPTVKEELAGHHVDEPDFLETPPRPAVPVLHPAPVATAAASSSPAPAATAASNLGSADHKLSLTMGAVRGLQVFTNPNASSVVIALSDAAKVSRGTLPKKHLVYFDIANPSHRHTDQPSGVDVKDGRIESVRVADHGRYTRVVIETAASAQAGHGRLFPNPDRFVVGVTGGTAAAAVAAPPRPAAQLADGGTSLSRALGLKLHRIVLDAGHGGHDTGTIGPGKLLEKNVVLDVTLRLGKLLKQRLGLDVVYTRDDDTFIPLQERTAIANRAHADLFLSIHANASKDRSARGVETYYLNLTHDAQALDVAARENAGSKLSMHDLQTLVAKIAKYNKMQESDELARDLDTSLAKATGEPDRGVKTAPFVVLIGAEMPSVLAEISFLSNPTDDRDLRRAAYRQKIAEALYQGLLHYIQSLAGPPVGTGVAMLN